MASGLGCSVAFVDGVAHVPPKTAQSRRVHSHVQHHYANVSSICHCLHAVHAQFLNVLFYAPLKHCPL